MTLYLSKYKQFCVYNYLHYYYRSCSVLIHDNYIWQVAHGFNIFMKHSNRSKVHKRMDYFNKFGWRYNTVLK